jgi:hypothetical protein
MLLRDKEVSWRMSLVIMSFFAYFPAILYSLAVNWYRQVRGRETRLLSSLFIGLGIISALYLVAFAIFL